MLLKFAAYVGSLAFFAFPFLFNPDPASTEFTPPVMAALGMTVAAAFPALALLAIVAAPTERRIGDRPYRLREVVIEMRANRSLMYYLAGFGCWAIADGVVVGLFIVYVDAYHGLSAAEGMILLAAYLSRVVAAPVALMVINRLPRRTFWVLAVAGNAVLYGALFLIPAGALSWLIAFAIVAGVIDCIIGILALMLLGDVIDDDARRTQRDKAASYKAMVNLVEKALRAMGLSGGLVIVGAAGLVVGQPNEPSALLALVVLLALAPLVLNAMSGLGMSYLRFGTVPGNGATDGRVRDS